ncbi:hypothetical protein [Candidatus Nitrosarchaeum limnium]|uniref:Uncharacterized protein n=1 Tax=Candidatus Nitrosarchaeum limnium BG20 TaxID=859192 RepID=S2E7T6_9ARCH|nr:hypothetical protein [Candidatus Nitrosarchaeum limnium]EPA06793.1 hypothetical protein BG20_I0089 [Candidatus Nitrosarchaeum limnium BG20]
MARIKIKLGENEIEVDSRDFYIDNQTLGEIITNISNYINENQAKIVYENNVEEITPSNDSIQSNQYGLEYLDDAETYEPEFNEPKSIGANEIKSKLRILETSRFFDSPRTVTETVQQLREYGWSASPLDVSKALAKMASNKEILKNLSENRVHYFIQMH